MNNTVLGSLSPQKDVVLLNPFQKKERNKISLSSDLVNSNTGKYATLPTRYIQRPQSCFVTSSKDTTFKSLDVILECSPQKVKMKQTINTDDLSSDMAQLKAAAARLKLTTKRPSYVAWQAKVQESSTILKQAVDNANCLTKERKAWISNTLRWIAQELADMRSQDQHLARQLLCIRQDIQQLKLDKSCEVHQDMLADVELEMEELEELAEICDQLPPDPGLHDNPLRHIGVTRMNISRRRFSTC
ncbi:protein FAM167B isoform X2 [Octopus bimaculoides]|uniref:Uncharacterized protein n=2 Tax=Octopus bimaculoides TaxID=37653 RepID=A0A0L8GYI4_OCTBM|nr:protein FAM167B isoform X2 [Octopus bimaculoides]XP_014776915.1 protein FAM167B isoform X2 [Octopus bimaculoides]XP_014776916.1 protein FAM167B isoform X2 [Octopus bimaculoides]|eukprot:XP_014776914.1 PREDICTED: protein FAM167B-like isoform X2 [Octopus bimaculoides]